ncbi:MAG: hypothetical protein U0570_03715 [Phycisphaerales bacterium]
MQCSRCGYDLRGIAGPCCPECGTRFVDSPRVRMPRKKTFENTIAILVLVFLGLVMTGFGCLGVAFCGPSFWR